MRNLVRFPIFVAFLLPLAACGGDGGSTGPEDDGDDSGQTVVSDDGPTRQALVRRDKTLLLRR